MADKIAEHIATSPAIEMDDFHDGWLAQRGNLGKASRTLRRPPADNHRRHE
ncbi:MAG: hypothetical protein IPM33_10685 [Phycisphaerales bacterium]|nr:hypothetical protein [Phycisphaerales bacterium]